jgi:hypothetical protein
MQLRQALPGIVILALASGLPAQASPASDSLCEHLEAFEQAPFGVEGSASRQRHWIEVHWRGVWLDFSNPRQITCEHSADPASVRLCSWLAHNGGSVEFADRLPRAILSRLPFPRFGLLG